MKLRRTKNCAIFWATLYIFNVVHALLQNGTFLSEDKRGVKRDCVVWLGGWMQAGGSCERDVRRAVPLANTRWTGRHQRHWPLQLYATQHLSVLSVRVPCRTLLARRRKIHHGNSQQCFSADYTRLAVSRYVNLAIFRNDHRQNNIRSDA